mmetsp:Transcript_135315/g.320723  ORF Transcript_135315/g.320723 Transcript_135315/m.320723 type:complete len:270 (-) Transcript_135315:219-1028(-)
MSQTHAPEHEAGATGSIGALGAGLRAELLLQSFQILKRWGCLGKQAVHCFPQSEGASMQRYPGLLGRGLRCAHLLRGRFRCYRLRRLVLQPSNTPCRVAIFLAPFEHLEAARTDRLNLRAPIWQLPEVLDVEHRAKLGTRKKAHSELPLSRVNAPPHHQPVTRLEDVERAGDRRHGHGTDENRNYRMLATLTPGRFCGGDLKRALGDLRREVAVDDRCNLPIDRDLRTAVASSHAEASRDQRPAIQPGEVAREVLPTHGARRRRIEGVV